MSRKKILYVITKSVWGGAQRYVFDLATNLPKDGFEIAVAAGKTGPLFDKLHSASIQTVTIPDLERDVRILKEVFVFWHLLKIFRTEKPNIIHLNSTKIGGLGALAALVYKLSTFNLQSLNIVFTVHGWGFNEDRPWWQKSLIWLTTWFSSLFQNKIICINNTDFNTAKKFIPQKKLALIFNGIDPPDFLSRQEARAFFSKKIGQSLTEKTVVIGTVAELTKNKGLNYLLDALQKLSTLSYKIQTIIIGDGEDRRKLYNHINRLGLKKSVFLTGFITDAPRYFKGFDIFVLPSLKEGLPYTVMEAMATELPLIATRVGGIPDLISPKVNGLIVPPKNSEGLAEALTYIITNDSKKTQSMGKKSADIIKERFTLKHMVKKTIELYNS